MGKPRDHGSVCNGSSEMHLRPSRQLAVRVHKASLVVDLLGVAAGLFLLWGWMSASGGWGWGPWPVVFLAQILFLVAPVRLHAKLWGIRVAGPVVEGLATVIGVLTLAFAVGIFVWELHWTDDLGRVMSLVGGSALLYLSLGSILLLKVCLGFKARRKKPRQVHRFTR